ncbi:hypothetical protein ACIPYS_12855 [Kitasatospora sp. NPDC089913]|uniref:hypothetical protein n=1 Tax=Streptomycetaceae TaxID=2062 RepID=UPI00087BB7E4|nr:hypothetical protein [Streptomyces sp. TLI_053]SDT67258.1 hypothetical protein SAMN05216371_3577 [Streptomyces sp. TLI_053]
MSQRRSYPNSGDFNLDDLFRPEPGQQPAQQPPQQPGQQPPQQPVQQPGPPYGQQPAAPPYPGPPPGPQPGPYPGQASGQPEYFGDSVLPTQAMPVQQQGMPAPGWGGAAHPGHPADHSQATQYLPQYPAADPQGAGGYPPARPGYADGPAPDYPDRSGAAPAGRGGGRSSGKLVIGGVVIGGIAAAALVAVLMSGDDKGGSKPQAAPATTGGSTTATTAQQGPGPTTASVNPEVKAQAQALSDLLGTASDSRQAVIGAVASVQKCEKLPESQQALTAAAGQRRELQTKLAALKTDKLAGGPQLVEQLNAAWAASASADDEYAAWAGDAQSGCDPKKNDNQHYKNAVAASGTATTAKKQASGLWNTVAGQTALPTRTDGDL